MTPEETEKLVRDLITENVEGFDGHQLKGDSRFVDVGMDSLDLSTVLLEIQEETGVAFPDEGEDRFDTLDKLLAFIAEQRGQ